MSDTQSLDQTADMQDGSLVDLFVAADGAIERRRCAGRRVAWVRVRSCCAGLTHALLLHRTENIFKQLDERSLTEDEERIIQQRVRACAAGVSTRLAGVRAAAVEQQPSSV
jgi:hypothetical protein